jgi:hypothetical protein
VFHPAFFAGINVCYRTKSRMAILFPRRMVAYIRVQIAGPPTSDWFRYTKKSPGTVAGAFSQGELKSDQ